MLKVLFIGGTGVISSACAALAIEQGMELYLLNRGQSFRSLPPGAQHLQGDIYNRESARRALQSHTFDVVVDWIAYTADDIERDIALFRGKTGQFVFISSASAYQTPPARLPIRESTPLHNPFWEYSRNKIAAEERLLQAYRSDNFPMTIVRPSHTYDPTTLPFHGGYTVLERIKRGKKVIVHGDGTSLWTLTHHRDFAKGFVGLLGNYQALGEAYHITADELLTWNQIAEILAGALGRTAEIVHLPSKFIAAHDQRWGDSLLGDKTHSAIFDNNKIKQAVPGFHCAIPFSRGAREIVAWYEADVSRQRVNQELDQFMDGLIERFETLYS